MIRRQPYKRTVYTILWVLAALFVVAALVSFVIGSVLFGVSFLVMAALVGPGGARVFH